ncbi:uncharacterized protein LOC143447095 [Clavelina lepadiformis]|uniref:Uncharacterized protein n=1 Tax=Clavelina lepadiformis TaxID=159417 RepID=A0ABP0GS81_CLALP
MIRLQLLVVLIALQCFKKNASAVSPNIFEKIRYMSSAVVHENSLQCYRLNSNRTITPHSCSPMMDRCITVDLVVQSHDVHLYGCATSQQCNSPAQICEQIKKHVPPQIHITRCSIRCCVQEDCNKPSHTDELSAKNELTSWDRSVLDSIQEYLNGDQPPSRTITSANKIETFPADDDASLTCYLGEDNVLSSKKCPSNWECGTIALGIDQTNGLDLTHVKMYNCFSSTACANPKALCQIFKKSVTRVHIVDCSLTCCKTNLCNKQVFETSSPTLSYFAYTYVTLMKLDIAEAVPNILENGLTCYETGTNLQTKLRQCPPNKNRCGVVSLTSGPSQEKTNFYTCEASTNCNNKAEYCAEIKSHLPEKQISHCSVSCCSDNKCNEPKADALATQDNDFYFPLLPTILLEPVIKQLNCYQENCRSGNVTLRHCRGAEECATLELEDNSKLPRGKKTFYICMPRMECEHPTRTCDYIKRHPPKGMTIYKCNLKCCSKDGCNKPKKETALQKDDTSNML